VKEVPVAERTYAARFERFDRQRLIRSGDELDFIRFSAVIYVNHRADIPGLKVVFRQIARQNNSVMFVNVREGSFFVSWVGSDRTRTIVGRFDNPNGNDVRFNPLGRCYFT
jgi:hypothetical protein